MKMISIRPHWAWLVVRPDLTTEAERIATLARDEIKTVENRTWPTNYRGRFAIQSSLYVPYEAEVQELEEKLGLKIDRDGFQFGGIIGTAEIYDCVQRSPSRWFFGPHGFLLRDSRPCAFVPASGVAGRFSETPENFREDSPVNVAVVGESELFQKL